MKQAVVTGASSGIGLEITKRLIERGFEVLSISRNPSDCPYVHPHFHLQEGDLLDKSFLNQWVNQTRKATHKNLHVLVHSAGFGLFKPFESISVEEIEHLTKIHLSVPMMLTRNFLQDLIACEAHIFAIGSYSGTTISRWGGPYAAAKAGLHHFMQGLFEDYRKQGLKVCTIIPDITDTPFYNSLDFAPANDPLAKIDPTEIANQVTHILDLPVGTVISEVRFRPQKLHLEKK